jgi:hypothetical protein
MSHTDWDESPKDNIERGFSLVSLIWEQADSSLIQWGSFGDLQGQGHMLRKRGERGWRKGVFGRRVKILGVTRRTKIGVIISSSCHNVQCSRFGGTGPSEQRETDQFLPQLGASSQQQGSEGDSCCYSLPRSYDDP